MIDESEKELYQYALYNFFSLVLPFVFICIIGTCMHCVKQGLTIILTFAVLRKFSGGYHAKTLKTCIICSSGMLFLCMMLSVYVKLDGTLGIATIVAATSLALFSPINNENRRIDENEKKEYKRKTLLMLAFIGLIIEFLLFLGLHIYASCFSIGILLAASLQIPCVFQKFWKLTKNER